MAETNHRLFPRQAEKWNSGNGSQEMGSEGDTGSSYSSQILAHQIRIGTTVLESSEVIPNKFGNQAGDFFFPVLLSNDEIRYGRSILSYLQFVKYNLVKSCVLS